MKQPFARVYDSASNWIRRFIDPKRSFVFAGPPGSGKTVYFVCATDRLQRFAIENHVKYTFTEENGDTLRFRLQALDRMQNGDWPDKTLGLHRLAFDFTRKRTLIHEQACISYFDCDGTAFDQAFGDTRVAADPLHEEPAQRLKDELDFAHGIFLVIDTPQFHNSVSNEAYQRLFNLFKHIQESAHPKKIAVVFTKKDVFASQPNFDPKERLKQVYPAAWNHLQQRDSEFFFVSAVKSPAVNMQGFPVPPPGYTTRDSENLLDPLRWMLGL